MKKKSNLWWLWVISFVVGLSILILANIKMQRYEVQEGQETMKDVARAARQETRSLWIPGIIVLIGSYGVLYFPKM